MSYAGTTVVREHEENTMSNEQEDLGTRRARENAARLAEHQRVTARPIVTRRDDVVLPTLTDSNRRAAEDAATVASVQRAQTVDWLTRKLGRAPSEAEIASATTR
jgi:hypothetical protein